MQTNLEALIEAAKHLSDDERKKLLDFLQPGADSPQRRHITEMRGLGKELWQELIHKIISTRSATRGKTDAAQSNVSGFNPN